MDPHRLAEERSIAMHRVIAEKMRGDPRILERARERVRQWRADRSVAEHYIDSWERELGHGLDDVCALLVDPGERARALRQVSPFAGALDPRERWAIWRAVGEDPQRGAGSS